MNILTMSHITKTFPTNNGVLTALDDVSLVCEEGSTTLIAGSCGSGKSVLMRIASGLIKPDSGTVQIVHGGKAAKAALVFQDADTQILGETPLEDVAFSLRRLPRKERRDGAFAALEAVGLASRAMAYSRSLSGGEKRCLAIASAIALERPLVIFDEPYSNLDYPAIKMLNALIARLTQGGRTAVILTHETEKALPLCQQMIVLYKGRKVYDGSIVDRPRGEAIEQWGIKEPTAPWL